MTHLSIVIPVRNRADQLKYCLRSLSYDYQDDIEDVEIIVVDYGGIDGIQRLVESYGFKYIYTHNRDIFCKPHALNIGLRAAEGEFVANIDADMILAPNFVAVLKREADIDKFVICRCWHLPKTKIDDDFNYQDLKTLCHFGHKTGIGACQMAAKSVWMDIGGQDENIIGWGSEDWDVVHRMRLKGLNQVYIHGKTSFLHLDHYIPFTTPYKNRKRHEEHDRYIEDKIKRGIIVRNQDVEWGKIIKITPTDQVNMKKGEHLRWRDEVSKKYKVEGSYPLISIIIASVRLDRYIARIIENVDRQTYPNKEVVICAPSEKITTRARKHCYQEGILLVEPEPDTNLGMDLNLGIANSHGMLIAKMDDDDIYFENYLMDLYYHLKEQDADLVGKAIGALFVKIVNDDMIYSKNLNVQRRAVVNHPHQILHGSTYLFKRSLWIDHKFPEIKVGEDTGFEADVFESGEYKLYMADPFNYIYCRREVSDHTFQIDVKSVWNLLGELGSDDKIVLV